MESVICPLGQADCTQDPDPPKSATTTLATPVWLWRTLTLDLAPASAYRSSIKTKGLKLNEKWPFQR